MPRLGATALEAALAEANERYLFSRDERPTAALVLDLLRARGFTLATAESCTGGLVAARLTDVPGASDVFLGSVVAYSNEVKAAQLGVPEDVLAAHGAVSEQAAAAMAHGARARLGADVAVAVTGVAGPGGGTEAKAGRPRVPARRRAVGRARPAPRLPRRPGDDPPACGGRGAPPRAPTCHTVVTDTGRLFP